MKKVAVAVCDLQSTYRERLAEYFLHKKGNEMSVFSFSCKKMFLAKKKTEKFDIVLWGTGFEEIPVREGEETLYIHLSETPGWPEEAEPALFKYQSAEELLRGVFACYLQTGKTDSCVCRKEKEIIGIYSPMHSRLQTPFALTLAQILAEEKKVLYMNLGEWAGFSSWLEEDYQRDLADLLYLLSGYGKKAQGILECVIHSVNRMDYIPPMTDAQLLCQTSQEEYLQLLEFLTEKTEYDIIIIDFGIMIPGFFSLLEQCTSIYGIVEQGGLARSRWQQFEAGIMKHGGDHLANKLECVSFSGTDAQIMDREPVLQQWLYGVLGDRARAARYMNRGAN